MLPSAGLWMSQDRTWYSFGVTNLVQRWVTNAQSNQGIVIKTSSSMDIEYGIASSEYADACRRPVLFVIYSPSKALTLAQ